ncbi:ABC transporter permease subunit [Ornithinimicrobium murale]|uniref:branched-chain amino acid ABC transporter ATP-binding protein/permease n=1 Tax=Ornithinimicrobium murale TaxID=1050153 RepID=UPI000E0DE2CC|nr:branched-chain amino acid ABC transporter ATP-binding protein/permease [Ornithinimicrobium murale]
MPETSITKDAAALGSRKRGLARAMVAPAVAIILVGLAAATPKFTADPFLLSFVPTVLVTLLAAMHVWLLLRVDLLSFGSPPFMAIGGYTLALVATNYTSNAFVLVLACFAVPALMALPLAVVLLRLRGTYFALVTFVLAQVVMLIIIIAEGPLGGSSGISGIPPATVGGTEFGAGGALVRFSVAVAIVGLVVAAAVAITWRRHFAALEENEPLAASLGLNPWIYKTLAFVVGSGVAGLAGLILINQLGNAHPDSFLPLSSVNHLAAAVIGGASFLGPVIGALLLSWLVHTFASQAQLSQLFLGAALIIVTLFARGGITGVVGDLSRAGAKILGRTKTTRLDEGTNGPKGPRNAEKEDTVTTARERANDRTPLGSPRQVVETGDVVLAVDGLSKSFGGVKAVNDVSFELRRGDVLGVIGPNGAGKTTMINMIAGAMTPTAGTVALLGKDVTGWSSQRVSRQGLARSYQQTSVFRGATVSENLARAKSFSRRWATDDEIADLLRSTGLLARLEDRAGDLPYGLQKLLGLILPLAIRPDVLLLDEPAAGLELSERGRIDQLVDWTVERGTAVLLVEHDMDLVRRICPRLLVMDTGKTLDHGSPDSVLNNPEVITAYLGVVDDDDVPETANSSQQEEMNHG